MKTLFKNKLSKLLLLVFMSSVAFVLCSCGFSGSKNPDRSSKESYVVDISNMYIEDSYLYFEFPKIKEDVIIISYINIDDRTIELTKIGIPASEDEVNTENIDLYYELRDFESKTFTVTAYTQSEDGTKQSNKKTCEFNIVKVEPTFNKLTKEISWQTNENIESYDLKLTATGTSKIRTYYGNTTGKFDASDSFREMSAKKVHLTITPNLKDNITTKNTYYYKREVSISIALSEFGNTYFSNNVIYWSSNDNSIFKTELPETYNLVIQDGEETITEVITIDAGGEKRYEYTPKTDNFSYTISGGIDHPNIIPDEAVTINPISIGEIESINFSSSTEIYWTFKKAFDLNVSDYIGGYNVYQNSEKVYTTTENEAPTSTFNLEYGDINITVVPYLNRYNYYCSSKSLNAFIGKTPKLELERIDDKSVKIKFSNVDENATKYSLTARHTDLYEYVENVEEGFCYTFTPKQEKSYYIVAKPYYEGKDIVINSESSSVCVEKFKHINFEKATVDSDRNWTIQFSDDGYSFVQKVEYSIETSREDCNSSGRVSADEINFVMPYKITDSNTTETIKIKLRYVTNEDTKTNIELSPGFDEYYVKNLPTPTQLKLSDSKLSWEYSTDIPHRNKYYVEIYRLNLSTYKLSLVTSKTTTEKELDLSETSFNAGSYYAKIHTKANEDRLLDGNEIILDSSKICETTFYKFNTPSAYPTDSNNVIFKVYAGESSMNKHIKNIKVKLYADDFEETKYIQESEELDIREYLTELGIDKINADITILGKDGMVNSDVKTVLINGTCLDGFAVNNEEGELSWNKFFDDSTYNYTFKMKEDGKEDYQEVVSVENLENTKTYILLDIIEYLKLPENINKSYSDLCLSVTTNVVTKNLTNQARDSELILAPIETNFEFNGLTYGVSFKDATALGFNFNVQLETAPNIIAKTINGTNLGTLSADNGQFRFASLGEGDQTIVFSTDINYDVLDEQKTLKIPYYHSLKVRGEESATGSFFNFTKGSYYYEEASGGTFKLNKSKSTPATVKFRLNFGYKVEHNGKELELENGVCTINLLESNFIKIYAKRSKGLVDAHTYNSKDYDTSVTTSYLTDMPPEPNYVYVSNGSLYVTVESYDASFGYIVTRESGLSYTREFPVSTGKGRDIFDPTEIGPGVSKFFSGEDLVVTIIRSSTARPIEADIVVEYTVP